MVLTKKNTQRGKNIIVMTRQRCLPHVSITSVKTCDVFSIAAIAGKTCVNEFDSN